MVSMRPVRLSATLGKVSTLAEPVMRKRPLIFVDGPLYREQRIGDALHLVDDGAVQSVDEAYGVRSCRIKGRLVIACQIGAVLASFRASVVLPARRGPTISVTGVSANAPRTRDSMKRLYIPPSAFGD
jgi:hypothetical protein